MRSRWRRPNFDYLFRELAISYLNLSRLADAQPSDLMPDTVGKGEAESNLVRAASNGFAATN